LKPALSKAFLRPIPISTIRVDKILKTPIAGTSILKSSKSLIDSVSVHDVY